ncbi:MAG: aminotransferase class V-fold PLP-dependent enzyme [Acidimicrobiales bacterium]
MAPSEATTIPNQGRPAKELLAEIAAGRAGDLDWKGGKAFSLVYNADDPTLEDLQHGVAKLFLHDNALNPFAYPSLMKMEADLVSMMAGLLGTGHQAGVLTSGGSESIFCAVQTARDHARAERSIAEPVVLLASTAHPAFTKAAHNLDVEAIRIPVDSSGVADVSATEAAIDDRTAMIVGSAPCYPYGVIDPIEGLAQLAASRGVLCHVDSCLGGLLLPFWAELGEPVPSWDFRVEGVTSMSADLHKYGYAYKGASVVLYRDRSLLKYQFFGFDDWPGGFYGSATPAGTRPAPPIAGAWATLMHLGRDGLLAKASTIRDTTAALRRGIESVGDFQILHDPAMSVLLFASASKSAGLLGAAMAEKGWGLDVVQEGLHLMVSPGHSNIVDSFVADLSAVWAAVSVDDRSSETPTYGSRAV